MATIDLKKDSALWIPDVEESNYGSARANYYKFSLPEGLNNDFAGETFVNIETPEGNYEYSVTDDVLNAWRCNRLGSNGGVPESCSGSTSGDLYFLGMKTLVKNAKYGIDRDIYEADGTSGEAKFAKNSISIPNSLDFSVEQSSLGGATVTCSMTDENDFSIKLTKNNPFDSGIIISDGTNNYSISGFELGSGVCSGRKFITVGGNALTANDYSSTDQAVFQNKFRVTIQYNIKVTDTGINKTDNFDLYVESDAVGANSKFRSVILSGVKYVDGVETPVNNNFIDFGGDSENDVTLTCEPKFENIFNGDFNIKCNQYSEDENVIDFIDSLRRISKTGEYSSRTVTKNVVGVNVHFKPYVTSNTNNLCNALIFTPENLTDGIEIDSYLKSFDMSVYGVLAYGKEISGYHNVNEMSMSMFSETRDIGNSLALNNDDGLVNKNIIYHSPYYYGIDDADIAYNDTKTRASVEITKIPYVNFSGNLKKSEFSKDENGNKIEDTICYAYPTITSGSEALTAYNITSGSPVYFVVDGDNSGGRGFTTADVKLSFTGANTYWQKKIELNGGAESISGNLTASGVLDSYINDNAKKSIVLNSLRKASIFSDEIDYYDDLSSQGMYPANGFCIKPMWSVITFSDDGDKTTSDGGTPTSIAMNEHTCTIGFVSGTNTQVAFSAFPTSGNPALDTTSFTVPKNTSVAVFFDSNVTSATCNMTLPMSAEWSVAGNNKWSNNDTKYYQYFIPDTLSLAVTGDLTSKNRNRKFLNLHVNSTYNGTERSLIEKRHDIQWTFEYRDGESDNWHVYNRNNDYISDLKIFSKQYGEITNGNYGFDDIKFSFICKKKCDLRVSAQLFGTQIDSWSSTMELLEGEIAQSEFDGIEPSDIIFDVDFYLKSSKQNNIFFRPVNDTEKYYVLENVNTCNFKNAIAKIDGDEITDDFVLSKIQSENLYSDIEDYKSRLNEIESGIYYAVFTNNNPTYSGKEFEVVVNVEILDVPDDLNYWYDFNNHNVKVGLEHVCDIENKQWIYTDLTQTSGFQTEGTLSAFPFDDIEKYGLYDSIQDEEFEGYVISNDWYISDVNGDNYIDTTTGKSILTGTLSKTSNKENIFLVCREIKTSDGTDIVKDVPIYRKVETDDEDDIALNPNYSFSNCEIDIISVEDVIDLYSESASATINLNPPVMILNDPVVQTASVSAGYNDETFPVDFEMSKYKWSINGVSSTINMWSDNRDGTKISSEFFASDNPTDKYSFMWSATSGNNYADYNVDVFASVIKRPYDSSRDARDPALNKTTVKLLTVNQKSYVSSADKLKVYALTKAVGVDEDAVFINDTNHSTTDYDSYVIEFDDGESYTFNNSVKEFTHKFAFTGEYGFDVSAYKGQNIVKHIRVDNGVGVYNFGSVVDAATRVLGGQILSLPFNRGMVHMPPNEWLTAENINGCFDRLQADLDYLVKNSRYYKKSPLNTVGYIHDYYDESDGDYKFGIEFDENTVLIETVGIDESAEEAEKEYAEEHKITNFTIDSATDVYGRTDGKWVYVSFGSKIIIIDPRATDNAVKYTINCNDVNKDYTKIDSVVVDDYGNIYALVGECNKVLIFSPYIEHNGENDDGYFVEYPRFLNEWGGFGGPKAKFKFNSPIDMAINSDYSVFICDTNNWCVKKYSNSGAWSATLVIPDSVKEIENEKLLSVAAHDDTVYALTSSKIVVYVNNEQTEIWDLVKYPMKPTRIRLMDNGAYIYVVYPDRISKYSKLGEYISYIEGDYNGMVSVCHTSDKMLYGLFNNGMRVWVDGIVPDSILNDTYTDYLWDIKKDIYINKNENIQDIVLNTSFHRFYDNVLLFSKSLIGRLFYAVEPHTGYETFMVVDFTTDDIKKKDAFSKDDIFVGINELVTSDVINRCIDKIYTYFEFLLDLIGSGRSIQLVYSVPEHEYYKLCYNQNFNKTKTMFGKSDGDSEGIDPIHHIVTEPLDTWVQLMNYDEVPVDDPVDNKTHFSDYTPQYYDFDSWCTSRTGDGAIYSSQSKIYNPVNVGEMFNLYAYWQPWKCMINFDANSPSGTTSGGSTASMLVAIAEPTYLSESHFTVDDWVFRKQWLWYQDPTAPLTSPLVTVSATDQIIPANYDMIQKYNPETQTGSYTMSADWWYDRWHIRFHSNLPLVGNVATGLNGVSFDNCLEEYPASAITYEYGPNDIPSGWTYDQKNNWDNERGDYFDARHPMSAMLDLSRFSVTGASEKYVFVGWTNQPQPATSAVIDTRAAVVDYVNGAMYNDVGQLYRVTEKNFSPNNYSRDLYARWERVTKYVKYHCNFNDTLHPDIPLNNKPDYIDILGQGINEYSVKSANDVGYIGQRHVLNGWKVNSSTGTSSVQPGDIISIGDASIDLYADWKYDETKDYPVRLTFNFDNRVATKGKRGVSRANVNKDYTFPSVKELDVEMNTLFDEEAKYKLYGYSKCLKWVCTHTVDNVNVPIGTEYAVGSKKTFTVVGDYIFQPVWESIKVADGCSKNCGYVNSFTVVGDKETHNNEQYIGSWNSKDNTFNILPNGLAYQENILHVSLYGNVHIDQLIHWGSGHFNDKEGRICISMLEPYYVEKISVIGNGNVADHDNPLWHDIYLPKESLSNRIKVNCWYREDISYGAAFTCYVDGFYIE